MRMEAVFYGQDDRVAHKWHHYLAIYERHLTRFRDSPVRLLELGVSQGGSLQVWRTYFGERSIVHGVDVDERCGAIDDPGITVHIGDSSDAELLRGVVEEMGGIDVVVDDASHLSVHQIAAFEALWPLLADGGIYVCEDTHSSYWPAMDGGYLKTGSFIEFTKRLIDRLHASYIESERIDVVDETFARQCRGIHVYDSMVVFEKDERRDEPFHTFVGQRRLGGAGR